MLIQQKSGNLNSISVDDRTLDLLPLEWYETEKRILHKRTAAGRQVTLKFMKESQHLAQDDIVYEGEGMLIVVDIIPCEAIVLRPASMLDMAAICYEIGNRHLPLFLHDNTVFVPYEAPLFRTLSAAGYEPVRDIRKLLHPVKTTIAPHSQGSTLFSKIMQFTTPATDA